MFQHILGSREGNENGSIGGNDGDILGIPIFYTHRKFRLGWIRDKGEALRKYPANPTRLEQ